MWYFSAFYSLLFQIKGLMAAEGHSARRTISCGRGSGVGLKLRFWFAPSLFWVSSSSRMLMAVMIVGLIASVVAFFNLWPRLSFFVCFVCFLSFVAATNVWSNYQSDGMLLEAGFLAAVLCAGGVLPGWGANIRPSRASLLLLQWEWFRIYFESGMVKLLSGDEQWRNLTAMDEYYQNGPLPTWIGWYVEHLPHWFHAASAAWHAGDGTRRGVHAVFSAPRADRLLLHRDAVGDWRHPYGELYVPQLPGSIARVLAAR